MWETKKAGSVTNNLIEVGDIDELLALVEEHNEALKKIEDELSALCFDDNDDNLSADDLRSKMCDISKKIKALP